MRQLIADVMGGVDHFLAEHLERWMDYDSRCGSFLQENRPKVISKVQEAAKSGDRRLLDLLFELQMGCLLNLHHSLVPRYEYFGSQQLGPDYSMLEQGTPYFNVEVRHIGKADLDVKYEQWINSVSQLVPNMGTGAMVSLLSPSRIGDFVPLDLANVEVYKERERFLTRLQGSTEEIAAFIRDRINSLSDMAGLHQTFPLPGFEEDLQLFVMKHSDLTRSSGLGSYSAIPFFKVNEPLRIVSVICEKLGKGQLRPGMRNVLAIYNTSPTLQRWHVPLALELMRTAAQERDDAFFSERSHGLMPGAQDYIDKSPSLTGVWYRTNSHLEKTRNGAPTWIENEETTQYSPNPDGAPLDASTVEFLEGLPLILKERPTERLWIRD